MIPLQFGKFADHPGDEIGLAQARRAFGIVGEFRRPCAGRGLLDVRVPDSRGGPCLRRGDDPLSTSQRASFATRSTLSATVPSFSWKTMSLSFFCLLLERNLQILFPKELRIAQPCSQNLLIARDDRRTAVVRRDVRRTDKRIGELARRIAAR
jgi:hypothetical protein